MRRETLIAAGGFASIPVFMLSSAVVCTWAIAHGASMRWRLLFRMACHGIPERCFDLWGVPMPICARCTGIYAGLFIGLAAFLVVPWLREKWLRRAMIVAVVPLAIDGLTQLARLRTSTNGLRVATGVAAGMVFAMWVLSAIERRHERTFTLP